MLLCRNCSRFWDAMKTGLTEDGMLIRFLRSSFVLPVRGFVLPFSVVAQQPRPTPDDAARLMTEHLQDARKRLQFATRDNGWS